MYIGWIIETTLANAGSAKAGQTFDNAGSSATAIVFNNSLASGTDDNPPTNGELALALDKFKDGETVDINLLITGPSQTGG